MSHKYKKRKSQRQRLKEYAFLKPVFRTRPRKEVRTMLPLHQKYAALADIAFRRNSVIIDKTLHASKLSDEFRYLPQHSTNIMRVFSDNNDTQIIAVFKAFIELDHNQIDTSLSGDVASDLAMIVTFENSTKVFKYALKQWVALYNATSTKHHILLGHSIAGAVAKYVYNHCKDMVNEIHTFNPQHGLAQMQHRAKEDKNYHSHYMLGNPLAVIGIQATPNTHVYIPQDEVAHAHLLKTFLNTVPD